ncbi:MAG: hypothetical protein H6682_09735 [Candidatus Eisenbacteria bacterium]|nr:hypothetical protein [Candidatus Eisenbacteria bacterium]
MRLPTVLWLATILLAAIGSPAHAETYQPLSDGDWWTYQADDGETETRTVDGLVSVFGRTTHRIRYAGGANDTNENYWTVDDSGNLYLHGFYFPTTDFGLVYDPPILYLASSPLFVGKTWQMTTTFYTLPDTLYAGQYDLAFLVYEEVELDLPVGRLHAFGTGQTMPSAAEYSLTGVRLDGQRGGRPDTWWSEDIGPVQFALGSHLQLIDYGGAPTPVSNRSWGSIKSTFRTSEK